MFRQAGLLIQQYYDRERPLVQVAMAGAEPSVRPGSLERVRVCKAQMIGASALLTGDALRSSLQGSQGFAQLHIHR